MTRTFYIYKYTNKTNNKIYVGQTIDIHNRHKSHKCAAEKGETGCPLFYRAIKKYGFDNFEFEVLDQIDGQKEADIAEKLWIKQLDTMNLEKGYNLSPGGGGRANPNNTDTEKQCPRCDGIKCRKEGYSVDVNQHDGVNHICRECFSKEQREAYASIPPEELEEINAKRREDYASNIEENRTSAREYTRKHRDKINKQRRERRQNNPEIAEKQNEIGRKNYLENPEKYKESSKNDRQKCNEINSKLTTEEIYAKTPFKFCRDCGENIPSNLFYPDISTNKGLSTYCKMHTAKRNLKRKEQRKLNEQT